MPEGTLNRPLRFPAQHCCDPRPENLFDAQSEKPGGPEGERQARIKLACLDSVDGLPEHIERVGWACGDIMWNTPMATPIAH